MGSPPQDTANASLPPSAMAGLEKMIGLWESSFLAGFQGIAQASSSIIPVNTKLRLPSQPCRFAMLSNFNVQDVPALTLQAGAGSAGFAEDDLNEVYWGFAGTIAAQLFAGRSTEIFPISNLNQIVVQARPAVTVTIWFAWWV